MTLLIESDRTEALGTKAKSRNEDIRDLFSSPATKVEASEEIYLYGTDQRRPRVGIADAKDNIQDEESSDFAKVYLALWSKNSERVLATVYGSFEMVIFKDPHHSLLCAAIIPNSQ